MIGYLMGESVVLIIAALCSLLGALSCSFMLTLAGVLSILMGLALACVTPIILYVYKKFLLSNIEKYLRASIHDFDDTTTNPVSLFWNAFQKKVGAQGRLDTFDRYVRILVVA